MSLSIQKLISIIEIDLLAMIFLFYHLIFLIYCKIPGRKELVEKLEKDEKLSQQKSAMEGLKDMKILLRYCEIYGVLDLVS